jgi:mannose-6-phosphate isomerase-like protein (cupin superfamily)
MNNNQTKKIEKPWGYELLYALTDKYAGKILFVKKGKRLSYQYHEKKDETMFIFKGKVEMTLEKNGEKQIIVFKEGDSIHFPPFTKHRVEAMEDSYILEVSTPELEDVVRIEDDFGRI